MIDSSGTVEPTGGFDLEAARASISHYRIENTSNVDTESAIKELVDQANLAEDAVAEIERLRAENAWLKSDREFQSEEQAARIKELEADLEQSERVIDQLLAMHQEGYLNSAIGRAFGISGTHVGKLIRKYQEEAGG